MSNFNESHLEEKDIIVEKVKNNFYASYGDLYAIGNSREDAVNRLKKKYKDSFSATNKDYSNSINENEIVVEKKQGEYKAYYKGEFAAAMTHEEAVEKVKGFYIENMEKKRELRIQNKKTNIFVSDDSGGVIGVLALVFFIVGLFVFPLIMSILAIIFGLFSIYSSLGKVAFIGGFIELIIALIILYFV